MTSQYQAPLASSDPARILGWCREIRQEGEAFISGQPGFDQFENYQKLIDGDDSPLFPDSSRLHVNRAKAQISDVVASLTNLRQLWRVTSHNQKFEQQAKIINKCSWAWWHNTFADLQIASALQYSAVHGTGYLFPRWNPNYHAYGMGDIELGVGSYKDFLPVWMGKDFNIQNAYAGIICEELPITQVCATWPEFADKIQPSHENASWFRRKTESFADTARSWWTGDQQQTGFGNYPTVRVYYAYVKDSTVNTTGRTVPMGEPETSWHYEVPSKGEDMPSGIFDPSSGLETYKKATIEDARLYPNRRLIIFTDTVILYDGPSFWFHGKLPVIKFTLDPAPWSYFGGSMARDVASIDEARNLLLRGVQDMQELKLDPPLAVDERYESSFGEEFSVRLKGKKYAVDFLTGELPIKPLLDSSFYNADPLFPVYLETLDKYSDEVTGRIDFSALAKARQLPSGDSQEKLLELCGPRTKAKSRNMERSMRELGEIVKGLVLQFYTLPRRFTLFGYEGVSQLDFDYDPGTLVPAELPGRDSRSTLYKERYQRAREFQNFFQYEIASGSLHDLVNMTETLQYQMLWKDGRFPIPPEALAERMNIPNFGKSTDTPDKDTWVGQFKAFKEIEIMEGARLQAQAQNYMMTNTMPPPGTAPPPGAEGGAPQQQQQGGGPVGRPPTFQDGPELEQKTNPDGSPRTTITTS